MNTTELLTIAGSIVPNREFIIFEKKHTTYEESIQRINRLSQFLIQLGVVQEDRIGMINVNCPSYIETYFAGAKIGAFFVPLNFRAKANELIYMINVAEIKVLFVGERYLKIVQEIRSQLHTVKHFVAIDGTEEDMFVYEEQLAAYPDEEAFIDSSEEATTILMFTSGTTGKPKAVPLSHRNFTSYILENVDPANPDMEERNLLTVPLYHIAGIQSALAAVYGGRTIILMRQFQVEEWLETAQNEKVSRAMLVPTMIKQIVDHEKFHHYDLSNLKIMTYGAAVMPFEVIKKAITLFPKVAFFNAFGQTESGSTITILDPEDHNISGTEEEINVKLKRLASSIGKPLPDVELRIIDNQENPVPANVTGEIVVRGSRIMSGYWQDEKKTVSAFTSDGWLRTSDMGWMDEDGYIYLTGRADDMIIRGGENISPREVEEVLLNHFQVSDVAVIGIPNQEWGQEPMAIIVAKEGEIIAEEELIEFCRSRLASFKCPRSIKVIDKLPRSPLGKLSRKKLVQEFGKHNLCENTKP